MKFLLSICLLLAGAASFAQMNGSTLVRRSIVCESQGNRPASCQTGLDQTYRIDLANQMSHAPCVLGQSYQINRGVIQVSNGCRAEFVAEGLTSFPQQNDQVLGNAVSATVVCESQSNRIATCATGLDSVMSVFVQNQMSHAACVEGQSFQVVNRNMIQVSNGCRASFIVNGISRGPGALE